MALVLVSVRHQRIGSPEGGHIQIMHSSPHSLPILKAWFMSVAQSHPLGSNLPQALGWTAMALVMLLCFVPCIVDPRGDPTTIWVPVPRLSPPGGSIGDDGAELQTPWRGSVVVLVRAAILNKKVYWEWQIAAAECYLASGIKSIKVSSSYRSLISSIISSSLIFSYSSINKSCANCTRESISMPSIMWLT